MDTTTLKIQENLTFQAKALLMLQSFETTGPPPPGHSGEFNTDQVLKNINSPAPGANCSVKTPVQPGFNVPKL